jgi:hypothetical protein
MSHYEGFTTELLLYQILGFLFVVFFNFMGGHRLIKFLFLKWSNIWRSFDWVLRVAVILLCVVLSINRVVFSASLAVLISLNLYFNSNIGLPDPRDQELKDLRDKVVTLTKKCKKLQEKVEKLQAQGAEKYIS